MAKNNIFERREQKYLISAEQLIRLKSLLQKYMTDDEYPTETIRNIYFDTSDWRMARTSLEKPSYREKLRLRCYEKPSAESRVYLEMKRKAGKTVYKRRLALTYSEALSYLQTGLRPIDSAWQKQIFDETDYLINFYTPLKAMMFISYNRRALKGIYDKNLRITIDSDITYRTENVTLQTDGGKCILPHGHYIMEIKALGALPLWLSRALNDIGAYPQGYSKYANCYKDYRQGKNIKCAEKLFYTAVSKKGEKSA